MPKSDKELTVEVVNSYITAWFGRASSNPLTAANVIDLIESTYSTISNLNSND